MEKAYEMIEDKLELPYEDIEISSFCKYYIPCIYINNMTSGFRERETEVWYEDANDYFPYLPWEYDEQQIAEWVSTELTSSKENSLEKISLKIFVEDYDFIKNTTNLYDIIRIYPGVHRVEIVDKERMDQDYYIMYGDEKNKLFHYYVDENEEWQSEEIKLK